MNIILFSVCLSYFCSAIKISDFQGGASLSAKKYVNKQTKKKNEKTSSNELIATVVSGLNRSGSFRFTNWENNCSEFKLISRQDIKKPAAAVELLSCLWRLSGACLILIASTDAEKTLTMKDVTLSIKSAIMSTITVVLVCPSGFQATFSSSVCSLDKWFAFHRDSDCRILW